MAELSKSEVLAAWREARRPIRARMKALRQALPMSAWRVRSEKITQRILALPDYASARNLALFWPIEEQREVDLRALDLTARSAGKRLFYPFMDPVAGGFRTGFRRVDDPATLAERGRGFAEPALDAPEAQPGDLDLILVPALAAAPSGFRLGYGSGFYDATLAEFCPPARTAIVIYDFQLLSELPNEPHDLAANEVITDERSFGVS